MINFYFCYRGKLHACFFAMVIAVCVSFMLAGIRAHAEPIKTEPLKIVVPPWGGENSQNEYFIRLLALAFSKTELTDGAVEIQAYPEYLTGTRFVADLKNNKTVNVIWHGTNLQRERDLLAIPISLTKELNEYRILLIRKEDQEKFSNIKTLDDLRKFTAGTSIDWPSKNILQHNNLPVMAVANTSLLYTMLRMKRFDYMSRNMFEIWGEAERYQQDGLVVEQTLLLHGGVPFYFFVSKANPKLAERIERGLRMAIADGSFEKLFLNDESFKRGNAEINSGKRRLLTLDMSDSASDSDRLHIPLEK
jgi:ABC-type amino acid transport substrate-binding protein